MMGETVVQWRFRDWLAGGGRRLDRFGIAKMHATAPGGWEWEDRWKRGSRRLLAWGPDRFDPQLQAQGMTECLVYGASGPRAGQIRLGGISPRLFVSGFARGTGMGRPAAGLPERFAPRWRNLEVTLYAEAGREATVITYAGIEAVCWPGGTPGSWTGFKAVFRNADGGRSLLVEVWMDRSGGRRGGEWARVSASRFSVDCTSLETDWSVYLRTEGSEAQHYRHFSIREIAPVLGPLPRRSPAVHAPAGAADGWDDLPDRGPGLLPPSRDPRPLRSWPDSRRDGLGSILDGSRPFRPRDWSAGLPAGEGALP